MIGRRMANIIKRFARHRDDMRVANFQRVRGLDAEWKLLRCPTEYCLPNLTPPWANRNLGANRSDVASGGIFKRRRLLPLLRQRHGQSEHTTSPLTAFALLSRALILHPPLVLPPRVNL